MSLAKRRQLIQLLEDSSLFDALTEDRKNRIDKKIKKLTHFIQNDDDELVIESNVYSTSIDLPHWVIAVPTDEQDDDVISATAATSFNSVSQLATFCFEDLQQPTTDPICPICLNNFTSKAIVRQLPCRHIFCDNCILQWFDHSSQCPKCRGKIQLESP